MWREIDKWRTSNKERQTEEGEAGEEGVAGALCIMKIENVWVNCKTLSDRIKYRLTS